MKKYKVMFTGIHVGNLIIMDGKYEDTANSEVINEISKKHAFFDALKKDISDECIPFFKVRLEHNENFETDDYQLIKESL